MLSHQITSTLLLCTLRPVIQWKLIHNHTVLRVGYVVVPFEVKPGSQYIAGLREATQSYRNFITTQICVAAFGPPQCVVRHRSREEKTLLFSAIVV